MSFRPEILQLSHAYGQPAYVRGGGGNTSCKDDTTLWIKKSGTSLRDINEAGFVALERTALDQLLSDTPPPDPTAREKWVKEHMQEAVMPESPPGRPSVEAPLHHTFSATFVVHTHPALVNGVTCAVHGKQAVEGLFPDVLWIPYVDPGYSLCRHVSEAIDEYKERKGTEPNVVFLQNHGVFVAGDSVQEIESCYERIMTTLAEKYEAAGFDTAPGSVDEVSEAEKERILALCRESMGDDQVKHIAGHTGYTPFHGPLSPDHVVYAKPYPLFGDPTRENVQAYESRNGFQPKVFVTDRGIFGAGATNQDAELACEFALEGGFVEYLTELFGGPRYMSTREYLFIENWEVEAYRRQVTQG